MGLSIVQGPPNAGRAGVLRQRFTAALGRDPLLVVPTLDDVFNFERELAPAGGALLGGTVTTFAGLFREVAAATGSAPAPELTDEQRLLCVRAATVRARPRLLRRSAERPGFAPALDELLGELQAARVSPAQVADGASGIEDSAFLSEIAAIYDAYLEIRTGAGRSDRFSSAEVAIAELRRDPGSWRARPVYLYGFDDMTGQQLALLAELAQTADVTVAVTYEDRQALLARSRLISRLLDLGPRDREADETLPANPANTASPLLFALSRGFLEPGAEPATPDGSLTILRNGGERREAEAVGGEVARLLAEGEDPESIAIAVRDASEGTLTDVLERYGIPVAVEADSPVTSTATGAALLGLLRAADDGTAQDLLAFLRAPGRGRGASVDDLERRVRTGRIDTAAGAAALWTEIGGEGLEPYEGLRDARDGRTALALAVDIVRDLAQWPLKREGRQGTAFAGFEAKELRAGEEIAARLDDLRDLPEVEPRREDITSLVESMTVPLWSGPAAGRVRVASPYRLRAARFSTLFVLALEDGSFPRHGGGEPFLSDDQRIAVGLPERIEPELEERYLFSICLSLPTDRLYLSHRACDEDGAPLSPSPYLDEVRALLDPPPPAPGEHDPLEEQIVRRRGLSEAVFPPAAAPSEDELARALAVTRARAAEHLAALETDPAVRASIDTRLAVARAYDPAPRNLRNDYVRARLAERRAYGGTTLEEYATCSYKWLIGRELTPKQIDPAPEGLAHGGAAHTVLEELYANPPTEGSRPTPETLAAWEKRAEELLAEQVSIAGGAAALRVGRRRLLTLVLAFLRRDADRRDTYNDVRVEASFGFEAEGDPGALDFGDWELHGFIDRIDVDRSRGTAIVHDYKLSRDVPAHGSFESKRKMQLALYLKAVEEKFSLRPDAGLYQPLGKAGSGTPRGLGRKEARDEELEPLALPNRDWIEDEKFDEVVTTAESLATGFVEQIRNGEVDRNPLDGKCPWFCTYAPICRMDRKADTGIGAEGGGEE